MNNIKKITNVTGYKFTKISNKHSLKDKILSECNRYNLKGTVLISDKGINFSIAGVKYNFSAEPSFSFKNTLKEKYLKIYQ